MWTDAVGVVDMELLLGCIFGNSALQKQLKLSHNWFYNSVLPFLCYTVSSFWRLLSVLYLEHCGLNFCCEWYMVYLIWLLLSHFSFSGARLFYLSRFSLPCSWVVTCLVLVPGKLLVNVAGRRKNMSNVLKIVWLCLKIKTRLSLRNWRPSKTFIATKQSNWHLAVELFTMNSNQGMRWSNSTDCQATLKKGAVCGLCDLGFS